MLTAILKASGIIPTTAGTANSTPATTPKENALLIHLPPEAEGIVAFVTTQYQLFKHHKERLDGQPQCLYGVYAPPVGSKITLTTPLELPATPDNLALPSRLESGKYKVGSFTTPGDTIRENYFLLELTSLQQSNAPTFQICVCAKDLKETTFINWRKIKISP